MPLDPATPATNATILDFSLDLPPSMNANSSTSNVRYSALSVGSQSYTIATLLLEDSITLLTLSVTWKLYAVNPVFGSSCRLSRITF